MVQTPDIDISSPWKLIPFLIISFLIGSVIFFIAGFFGAPRNPGVEIYNITQEDGDKIDWFNQLVLDKTQTYAIETDLQKVDPMNIRNNLLTYSQEPHLAGEARDDELVEIIKQQWEEAGLDLVDASGYEVMMSYPNRSNPNFITLHKGKDEVFRSSFREDFEDDLGDDFVDAFVAYSPEGTVRGNIVYVNYGRVEDFEEIESFNLTEGNICLIRYGKLFRGDKVINAQDNGCIGVILFSDPEEVAANGTTKFDVYPYTFWLPESGIQRGTLAKDNGDPETPFWPSLPDIYRINRTKVSESLPDIPVQPIGYGDAKVILQSLDGPNVPLPSWIGGIEGVNYNLGGSFKDCASSVCFAKLEVHNYVETRESKNIIGVLQGDIEPDRYVLIGNHRDAWGYGAIDPSSATAQLTEVVRVLGQKRLNENWRPRRTMIFLSWGAEEYSLLGSWEFAEDFAYKLSDRSVAYLNMDSCTSGPVLVAEASPTVRHKVLEATQIVDNPFGSGNYYTWWKDWYERSGGEEGDDPEIFIVGSGSDHSAFIFNLGIPVLNIGFDSDTVAYPSLAGSSYPTYHTGFETFELVDEIVDPGFLIHKTCAQLSIAIGRDLADSLSIEYRPGDYGRIMVQAIADFNAEEVLQTLKDMGVKIGPWLREIDLFVAKANNWQQNYENTNITMDPMAAKFFNDQMAKLDQSFLLPNGLPGRPGFKHAIISPSMFDSYGSSIFPGISDLLHDYENLNSTQQVARVDELNRHVSDLRVVIKRAGDFLQPPQTFL